MDTNTLLTLAQNQYALAATTLLSTAVNAMTQEHNDFTCEATPNEIIIEFKQVTYPHHDDIRIIIDKNLMLSNEPGAFCVIIDDGHGDRYFDDFAQVIGLLELKLS